MAGDVRHFEIPYVRAYLAKRFHMTAFSWKLNDTPHSGNTMFMTGRSVAHRMPTEMSMVNGNVLGRNATAEARTATISMNAVGRASEQTRQESGEIVQEKQYIGEMG